MSAKLSSSFPITPSDLEKHRDRANQFLIKSSWKLSKSEQPSEGSGKWRPSTEYSSSGLEHTNVTNLAKSVSGDALLLSDEANAVMRSLRDGLCIGMHLAQAYGQAGGLERLISQNRAGQLSAAQKAEFFEKHHTSAAIALYSFAAYVHWKLGRQVGEESVGRQISFPEIPEVDLSNPLKSLECAVFHFGFLATKTGLRDGHDMYRYAQLFAERILDEIRERRGSLKHTEFFDDNSYRLEDSEFMLSGFDELPDVSVARIEFNRLEFKDIVGNRAAKHAARRLAQRLVCYDLAAKKNPFLEIGGLPLVRMGYGKPGTGKSMQIAATATKMSDYCEWLGLPFMFWPLPDNIVSTFQGGSAERMIEFMRRLQDDDKIVYAPMDDAENCFEDRSREGVSAGVREVIGVFLRYTEGAYAIKRGNTVVEFFTNLPEQLDKAVLSRVQARFPIDGADSREDFLDQDHLWWRGIREIDGKVVNLKDPRDYEYLSSQADVSDLSVVEKEEPQLEDDRLRGSVEELLNLKGRDEHDFFALFFQRVLDLYPTFSSRDVRNIQQAVNNRLNDFDMPDEWFEDAEIFFYRDYETKVEMLKDLMRGNMKGLSFADLRWREAVKYCNNLSRILNQDRERKISNMLFELDCRSEAEKRFLRD